MAQPQRMLSRLATLLIIALAPGCAAVGEALGATCISLAASTAGELCFRLGVAVLCDDDDGDVIVSDDDDDDGDDVPAEIGPRLSGPLNDVPPCRVSQLDGGVWRLICVDGSSAEALVAPRQVTGGGSDVDGPLDVDDLDDVFAIAGKRALQGPLTIRGNALLRLELPSLQSIRGT